MARVDYSGTQTVNPQGADGNNYQRISANPDAFGMAEAESNGLLARGQSQLAGAVSDAADKAYEFGLKQQGMINEAASTDGETEFIKKSGDIWNGYRNTKGLAAYASRDQAAQQIQNLRTEIEAKMPNDFARRAFTMMAVRHEASTLADISAHSAREVTEADNASATASMNTSVAQSNSYAVASNDARFNDTLQTTDFQLARLMKNRGWDAGTGMAQNPQTGEITFNDTPQGQQAKAIYDDIRNEKHGESWENRIRALTDDPTNGNINKAMEVYEANKDKMPAAARAKIGAFLQPKFQAAQVNTIAASAIGQADRGYVSSLDQSGAPQSIDDAILGQESGGNDNIGTSVDGAVGPGQILPSTFQQYAKPGEDITNPEHNRAVKDRILADYKARWPGDPARVAVAYFSGPGNVAPAGSHTPWINDAKDGNGKQVSAYVGDIKRRMGLARAPMYVAGTPLGLSKPGNIDIANRPQVKNADGSVSTVRSITVGTDQGVVVLPTISPDGKNWTNAEAIAHYKKTGENLGTFKTERDAIDYAENLHEQQASMYVANKPIYQNKANYYRENYSQIMANAEAEAERHFPGRLDIQQSVRSRMEQRINDTIQAQSAQDMADQNKLFAGADGALTNGVKPTSIDALIAIPEMRRAYESMLMNNPKAAEGLDRLITANSRGTPNGYGTDFYRFYQEAMSGDGDVMKFARYVNNGREGALTTAGFNEIKAVVQRNLTPEGKALSDAERRFYQAAHAQLTFTNPKQFLHDPKGEENFTKFMQATLPSIQAGLKNGISPAQLFDPKSPEYVGKSIGMFMRPINQMVQDQINATSLASPGQVSLNTGDAGKYDLSKPDGLKAAVAAGVVDREEGKRLAVKNGWAAAPKPAAPAVPAPTFE